MIYYKMSGFANQIISSLPSPISGNGLFAVNVVVPNNNFQTNTNEGNYDLSDTIGSTLEVFGFSTLNTLAPIKRSFSDT